MSVQLQSVDFFRDTVRASIADLEGEGRACPTVCFNGGVISTWGRMRLELESASEAHLKAMLAALNQSDVQAARNTAQSEHWQQEDARRAHQSEPMTPEEYARVNAASIEAGRRAAERQAAPLSAAQGDEMMSLLREISEKLEKRNG